MATSPLPARKWGNLSDWRNNGPLSPDAHSRQMYIYRGTSDENAHPWYRFLAILTVRLFNVSMNLLTTVNNLLSITLRQQLVYKASYPGVTRLCTYLSTSSIQRVNTAWDGVTGYY